MVVVLWLCNTVKIESAGFRGIYANIIKGFRDTRGHPRVQEGIIVFPSFILTFLT